MEIANNMKVFRGIPGNVEFQTALTIGNFDGIHIGHQAMIERVCSKAKELGLASAVMLFEPQPREFFQSSTAPPRLTSLREKLEIIRNTGVELLYIVKFNQEFSNIPANEFIENILLKKLRVRWLLIGDDFRFGANREGGFPILKKF